MEKRARRYLKKPYARILIPDETGMINAQIEEFPGCFAYGDSPEQAFKNLERAGEAWIEAALAEGQEIPEPLSSIGFSGNFALRMPRSLHRRAAQFAERDRVSLNQFFVAAIAERIGAQDIMVRVRDWLRHAVAQARTIAADENAAKANPTKQRIPPLRSRRRVEAQESSEEQQDINLRPTRVFDVGSSEEQRPKEQRRPGRSFNPESSEEQNQE
jgi:predicted RNase H-like HicB family nuclease